MKLSRIIIEHRERIQISQREFARRCGLSNSYISFIEKECDPKTKKPPVPTIRQYKKIADAMEISLQALFEKLDGDAPVDLSVPAVPAKLKDDELRLLTAYRSASDEIRRAALSMLENSAAENAPKKDSSADRTA